MAEVLEIARRRFEELTKARLQQKEETGMLYPELAWPRARWKKASSETPLERPFKLGRNSLQLLRYI